MMAVMLTGLHVNYILDQAQSFTAAVHGTILTTTGICIWYIILYLSKPVGHIMLAILQTARQ